MNYTLSQIHYALAVWKHGSFSKAAKACFVTQPTLSMQLSKLEEQLELTLFDRSRQPIAPTAVGREILLQFQNVQNEIDRVGQVINQFRGVVAGEYRLGVIPTVAPMLLPDLVAGFLKHYPDVRLRVREMTTAEIVIALRDDRIDGGLLATPLNDPKIAETPIFDEPLVVFPSKEMVIKSSQGKVRVEDLPLESMVMMSEGHCLRTQVMDLCAMQKAGEAGFALETGSVSTLVRLVEKGPYFTVLPYLATLDLSTKARSRVLAFTGDLPIREIGLVTHRSQVKAAINEALVQQVKNSVGTALTAGRKVLRLSPL